VTGVTLSIVTTTRTKVAHLRAALRNLAARAGGRPDVELVVVNDGSEDGTEAFLDAFAAEMPFVRLRTDRVGLAAARNAGVRASHGTHLLFMDDDIVLGPGYLESLLAAIAARPERVHVGNLDNVHISHVAPLLEDAQDPLFAGFPFLDEFVAHNSMFTAARHLFAGRRADGVEAGEVITGGWWAVSTGGNLCVPREGWERAGGFDEEFKSWGPEDAEFCFRLFRLGYTAAFNPGCRLYHLDHARDTASTRLSLMQNAAYMMKKHGKPQELYSYLELTGGIISVQEFNNRCARWNGIPEMVIEECFLTLKYVTKRDQLIPWKRS
jgi:GT2 family glycosyltransferase